MSPRRQQPKATPGRCASSQLSARGCLSHTTTDGKLQAESRARRGSLLPPCRHRGHPGASARVRTLPQAPDAHRGVGFLAASVGEHPEASAEPQQETNVLRQLEAFKVPPSRRSRLLPLASSPRPHRRAVPQAQVAATANERQAVFGGSSSGEEATADPAGSSGLPSLLPSPAILPLESPDKDLDGDLEALRLPQQAGLGQEGAALPFSDDQDDNGSAPRPRRAGRGGGRGWGGGRGLRSDGSRVPSWTVEEDLVILQMVQQSGKRWSAIAKRASAVEGYR